MKKAILSILLALCMMCTLLPVTAGADEPPAGSTNLEDVTFGYAYDAQRSPAYPAKGQTVSLTGITYPYGANGNQLNTNEGIWKLTKVGAYSTVDNTIKNANSGMLTTIVDGLATKYNTSANSIIIHKLENNSNHIAYGVVVAYDSTNVCALFLGNNSSSASGGVGFVLSKNVMSSTGSIVASIDIADIIKENTTPTVTMLDANGNPISNTNLPKVGDTLSAKVENAPAGKELTYKWNLSETGENGSSVGSGTSLTLGSDTAGKYIELEVTWPMDNNKLGYASSGAFQIAAAEDNTPVDDPAPSTGHAPIRRQNTTTTTVTTPDSTTTAAAVTSPKTGDAGIAVYAALSIMSMTGSAWIVDTKRRR